MEKGDTYKSILKGMSFFGGAQVFQILINLVRGKFVALLLGPEGMGISSLFAASSNTIQQLAILGLPTSIVKEVASAKNDDTASYSLEEVVKASRQALLITACLGTTICIAFSWLLSRWTFGNADFTWQYMLLSLAVLFGILSSGEMSLLQGIHQVKKLSWSSVVGASTGLAIGVPLYYFFGNQGIVPGMIAISLASYIFYKITSRKLLPSGSISIFRHIRWHIIRKLISLGLVLMAGSLIGTLATYLLNTFIRYIGGIDDVGYFQAANSITNQYAGVVFAAMSVDYFPRLMAVASDNAKMTEIVNRQTEIVALIMAPLMIALMLSAPLVIHIFLSSKFEITVPLVQWLGLGIFLRAMIFPPGYIAFAKGNKKLFFMLEGITGNILFITINCLFYYIYGLIGLGMAMCASYILSFVIYYAVKRHYYSYFMNRDTAALSIVSLLAVVTAFVATQAMSGTAYYIAIVSVLIFSSVFSIVMLIRKLRT